MAIDLSSETRKQALASVRRYFLDELELDIGDLKADLVLQFFLKEIAPSVHNAAVDKVQTWVRDRVADLDGLGAEPEFAFRPKSVKRR